MSNIRFDRVKSEDKNAIERIAQWYFQEWNIDPVKTTQRLSVFPGDGIPFQILMSIDEIPVATGGLYEHVGLLDVAPKFRVYGPWLALVLTLPEHRNKGYGTLLCEEIEERAKALGFKELFLFTSTAKSLYKGMGWVSFEERSINGRNVAVMKKALNGVIHPA